jgi:tRNA modification GTPase
VLTYDDDTIAAISTPIGEGGIGIVRLSGTRALDIVQTVFCGTHCRDLYTVATHTLHHGRILNPHTSAVLDEVLVAVMRAPRSYTREDVVEIHCHGGPLPLRDVLNLVLEQGARLAAPGEFTKRAFLNGRIDLSQAESVIDIIRAKTDVGLQLAVRQLQGTLSQHVRQIHQNLKQGLAAIEASIDFPEDEIELISDDEIESLLTANLERLEQLLAGAHEGRILREGLSLVIAGKPNVGKSSLLNWFLAEERAIVTAVAGTTRDTIEDSINLNGVPLRLIDTAGIRDTADHVEGLGVARSRAVIARADLVLCMFDASVPWSAEDERLLECVADQEIIIVANKSDLPPVLTAAEIAAKVDTPAPAFDISIKESSGLDDLKQAIVKMVLEVPVESVEVTNSRHKQALSLSRDSLLRAHRAVQDGLSHEFVALDVREALDHLGLITGETTREDILDEIFATFCIGK